VARLTRYFTSDIQTRGILQAQGLRCKTLELPWRGNRNRISCIPTGTYRVERRPASASPSRDYDPFHLQDVPERTWILIHAGNLYTHTAGCVLVGDAFVDINGDGHPDVTNSMETLSRLLTRLPPTFDLTVEKANVDRHVPAAEPKQIDTSFDFDDVGLA